MQNCSALMNLSCKNQIFLPCINENYKHYHNMETVTDQYYSGKKRSSKY